MDRPKLSVELVPTPQWGHNLRSMLPAAFWEKLSLAVRQRNDKRCEVCHENYSWHCHEQWHYDDDLRMQSLVGLQAVCRQCHAVMHLGRTLVVDGNDAYDAAIKHLARVNDWSDEQAQAHANEAFMTHAKRSGGPWVQDLRALDDVPEFQTLAERTLNEQVSA